jgi:hypothetical protein
VLIEAIRLLRQSAILESKPGVEVPALLDWKTGAREGVGVQIPSASLEMKKYAVVIGVSFRNHELFSRGRLNVVLLPSYSFLFLRNDFFSTLTRFFSLWAAY